MTPTCRTHGLGLKGLLFAAALAVSAPLATPVLAADGSAAALPPCAALDPAQMEADTQVVDDAMGAFQRGGFPALRARLPDLLKVMDHAPRSMATVEACDGRVIIHAASMDDYLAIAAAYKGQDTEWRATPYPRAALLAGSTYVEYHDYNKAAKVLLAGVAIAPDDAILVGEAAGALNMLKRFDEALAMIDATLARNPDLSNFDHARLLRAKGFAYAEMQRFDEAEAAYRESLTYDPGNRVAAGELQYIAGRRKGAPAQSGEPVNSVTGEPNKH